MGNTLPNMTQEESTWVYEALGRAKQEIENHSSIALTDSEKGVLQGLIEGKQHKDISADLHLTLDYARETASKLYQYVKKLTSVEKVDKNTIRLIIEEQLKLRNIPKPSPFYGREGELSMLEQQIVNDRTALIELYGLAGIGKTSLVAKVVRQPAVYQRFERVIWLSLEHCPSLEQSIAMLKARLPDKLGDSFRPDGDSTFDLTCFLSNHSYCLVLDGVEGDFIHDSVRWAPYTRLLTNLGRAPLFGRSCVIVTSQIKLGELKQFKNKNSKEFVHSEKIDGLEPEASKELLRSQGLKDENDEQAWGELMDACSRNPGYLNIIASTIRDHFKGRVADFCSEGTTCLASYEMSLSSIFQFLDPIDKHILKLLAEASAPGRTHLIQPKS